MVDVISPRNALYARIKGLFEEEVFSGICPSTKAPKVYLGFPTNEPPVYVAVDEVADSIQTSGSASMGHAEFSFDLHLWLYAQHTKLETSANMLLSYIGTVFAGILADPQLNGTVDNAFPRVDEIGTAAVEGRRYVSACVVSISCKVSSVCPNQIKEVVDAINRS